MKIQTFITYVNTSIELFSFYSSARYTRKYGTNLTMAQLCKYKRTNAKSVAINSKWSSGSKLLQENYFEL